MASGQRARASALGLLADGLPPRKCRETLELPLSAPVIVHNETVESTPRVRFPCGILKTYEQEGL